MAKKRAESGVKLQVMGIEDLQTADKVLKEIGDLEAAIGSLEKDCRDVVQEYLASMQEEASPLQEKIKLLKKGLQAFCKKNRAAVFKDAKSVKLAFGAMGWRESTRIKTGDDVIGSIRRVYGKLGEKFIRTQESVIVELLKDMTGIELSSIGCERETKDKFFAEPAAVPAVDYKQAE